MTVVQGHRKEKELEVSDPTTAKEQIFDVFFLLRSIF
jgi:hypothetical protein